MSEADPFDIFPPELRLAMVAKFGGDALQAGIVQKLAGKYGFMLIVMERSNPQLAGFSTDMPREMVADLLRDTLAKLEQPEPTVQ